MNLTSSTDNCSEESERIPNGKSVAELAISSSGGANLPPSFARRYITRSRAFFHYRRRLFFLDGPGLPPRTSFGWPRTSNVTSDQRNVTTVPQQQLFVLNNPFMFEMSHAFAMRLETAASDDENRLRLGWQLAYGRPPTSRNMAITSRMFSGNSASGWASALRATALNAICFTHSFADDMDSGIRCE